jgi:hypothetical protein
MTEISRPESRETPLIAEKYLSEDAVYAQYGKLLKDKELRRARQSRQIDYIQSGRDFFYTPGWVEDYLESKRVSKCDQNPKALRAVLPGEVEAPSRKADL